MLRLCTTEPEKESLSFDEIARRFELFDPERLIQPPSIGKVHSEGSTERWRRSGVLAVDRYVTTCESGFSAPLIRVHNFDSGGFLGHHLQPYGVMVSRSRANITIFRPECSEGLTQNIGNIGKPRGPLVHLWNRISARGVLDFSTSLEHRNGFSKTLEDKRL